MAVQFPNFLSVPVRNPDYSGIGDIVQNYYAGKQMPKDDLLKAIQAEFARPTAEAALKSANLGNTQAGLNISKTGLDIRKMQAELNEQEDMARQLRVALGGGSPAAQPMPSQAMPSMPQAPMQQPVAQPAPQPMQMPAQTLSRPPMTGTQAMAQALSPNFANRMTLVDDPAKLAAGLHPQLAQAFTSAMQNQQQVMPQEQAPQEQAPSMDQMAQALAPKLDAQVISEGVPALYKVDELWEKSPNLHPYLEKKGYKGSQEIKFDNKTGKTSVITSYPSGKITVKSAGAQSAEDGAPLTTKMISKHQNIISSIDNAVPIIQQIKELNVQKTGKDGKPVDKYWEPFPRTGSDVWYELGLGSLPGYKSAAENYEALVSSALDSLVGAYGLPSTNEGMETVKKQLQIGHGETDAAYMKRLDRLMEDLQRRKAYSSKEVKRSNKIMPVGRMGGGDESYSSDDWEQA